MLLIYITLVFLLSYTNSIEFLTLTLLSILVLLLVVPIREKLITLRNTVFSALFFTMLVSLTYLILSRDLHYFAVINLRVLDITLLTMIFVKVVNLYSAVSFSRSLSYILVLTYSQIMSYKRLLREFNEALTSRLIEKPERSDIVNYTKRLLLFFFDKSTENSVEIYQAMKSRGFDLD